MACCAICRRPFDIPLITSIHLRVHHSMDWWLGHRAVGILVALPAIHSVAIVRTRYRSCIGSASGMTIYAIIVVKGFRYRLGGIMEPWESMTICAFLGRRIRMIIDIFTEPGILHSYRERCTGILMAVQAVWFSWPCSSTHVWPGVSIMVIAHVPPC